MNGKLNKLKRRYNLDQRLQISSPQAEPNKQAYVLPAQHLRKLELVNDI